MIVIADDITGAAEIAGIAKAAGVDTRLVMVDSGFRVSGSPGLRASEFPNSRTSGLPKVLVLATDTRQMSEPEAVAVVENIAKACVGEVIFKKTDSVLRGHIQAECEAILRNTDYEKVLLVPQNPSKGRVVRGGIYYINDVPLDETQFAFDPEFPAKTADVKLFGVPDAESVEDIERLVAQADGKALLAGGADLFQNSLTSLTAFPIERGRKNDIFAGDNLQNKFDSPPLSGGDGGGLFLMVCGSTQSKSVIDTPLCRKHDAVECNMPEDVFLGKAGAEAWLSEIKEIFPERGVVLTINYPSQGGKDFAVRLRKTMAEVVKGLVEILEARKLVSPDARMSGYPNIRMYGKLSLIIEGGATAFEILSQLGWTAFDVRKEHFPGVVELENEWAKVILKPGSYPWKGLLDNENRFN